MIATPRQSALILTVLTAASAAEASLVMENIPVQKREYWSHISSKRNSLYFLVMNVRCSDICIFSERAQEEPR